MISGPAAQEGEFEREMLPHLDSVYHFALRLAGSPDAAEDLVQDTYLRAYRAFGTFTQGTRAKSWLFTICRNVFLRRQEREQRHADIVAREAPHTDTGGARSDAVAPLWSGDSQDPEGEFFASIVDAEVLRAIDALAEEFRTAVVLSDLEGLSYQEIADLMEVPVGTVKSRLSRGRRQLQRALYDYAVDMGYTAPAEVREE